MKGAKTQPTTAQKRIRSGDLVIVTNDRGNTFETTTRSDPWQLGTRNWVILLEGISGGYDLRRVKAKFPRRKPKSPMQLGIERLISKAKAEFPGITHAFAVDQLSTIMHGNAVWEELRRFIEWKLSEEAKKQSGGLSASEQMDAALAELDRETEASILELLGDTSQARPIGAEGVTTV